MGTQRIDGHTLTLTHEDKIYFPVSKITKGALLDYYQQIAPYLLSYCHNRPITLDRFPEGITGPSFYQKNASSYFPDWITVQNIPNQSVSSNHDVTRYVLCNTTATLVYLANQGCITPHMWLSRVSKLNYPDILIFDLDPAEKRVKNFNALHDAALIIKAILEQYGLRPLVMTTGSRGLHVRVAIKPEYTFDEVRACAHAVAEIARADNPHYLTLETRKEKRDKKLFIDTLRNSFGATAVIPYAVRAHEGAPVATPLEWQELTDKKLRSDTYTIKTIFKRITQRGDVWDGVDKDHRSLKKAVDALLEK